jgi:integrase/recombinase XerD
MEHSQRSWLGHVSIDTTNIYAELDLEMKATALAKCAIDDQRKPTKRWRDRPCLMEFLCSL